MRIVDVNAFYTPAGGGVRTYVRHKLKAAPALGHEMIVLAPGPEHRVQPVGDGGLLVTIPAPPLSVDKRYHYFDDEGALHRALDQWRPDHVEASSPWSSATFVGRWQGAASRSLVMHADPMASYPYRWFGGVASIETIDRWFNRFWRHLRGLDQLHDAVITSGQSMQQRLLANGLTKVTAVQMGVEPGIFASSHRSAATRERLLAATGLGPNAVLLLAVGRFAAEKRWPMVLRAAQRAARADGAERPIGLVLIGDGTRRPQLERLAWRLDHVAVLPPIADRAELARVVASADALVHGCESETYCMVTSEARASGVPLIVPDRGAAVDHLAPGAGLAYASGDEPALAAAMVEFVAAGPELQRARARSAIGPGSAGTRSIEDHFTELFALYERLQGRGRGRALLAL